MSQFKLKDYILGDTIAAIATFPSKSALGVVKISGKSSLPIISRIFKPAKNKNIKKVKTHTLHYGWIVEKSRIPACPAGRKNKKSNTNNLIDEVLVSVMRTPNSYTREDVVEVSSHGGTVVLNKILEIILEQGARLALPGEFTYRALVRGRIDLLQAEGVLGIVEAKSLEALELASSQLKGYNSQKIEKLKAGIKELFVHTESLINFPDEDRENFSVIQQKKIKKIREEIDKILQASSQAKAIREGMRCVICGKTNSGKSTLFNYILQEERAIVSKICGTTRDVIEENVNIRGVNLRICDTAGILKPEDSITKKALEKSSKVFEEADLVILVLDASRPLNDDDFFLLEKSRNKNTIIVINKIDLFQRLDLKKASNISKVKIRMSALKNIGLKDLENAIYSKIYEVGIDRENLIFLNQYQHEILKKAKENISQIEEFSKNHYTVDFINLALKECLDNLGRLSGEVFCEEVLESIFSKFCIGK